MKTIISLMVFFSLALSACGTRESLARKSGTAPSASELTGRWTLVESFEATQRELDRAIGATNGVDEARELRRLSSAQSKGKRTPKPKVGGLIHVFLENGKTLKISQSETDLYISFNRSVVEEYHFGEARMIRVGEASAQRVSGWEDRQFVVETLGKKGMKLTERYYLIDDGTHLRRQIVLRSKEGEEFSIVQNFSRDAD
jgi:hypothetical protein